MDARSISRGSLRRISAQWHQLSLNGRTYCIQPGGLPAVSNLPKEIHRVIEQSETGAVLFSSLAESHLVVPPFAVEEEVEHDGWNSSPLHSLLDKERRILVVLLRLGGVAIGVFEGERLITSKVDTRFVKGRHKKGGSSSARFARRREEQTKALFAKACAILQGQLEHYSHPLTHVVTGGDRLTLQAFEKQCPCYATLAPIRQRRVLDVPNPRLRVLRDCPRLIYSSRVITFTTDYLSQP